MHRALRRLVGIGGSAGLVDKRHAACAYWRGAHVRQVVRLLVWRPRAPGSVRLPAGAAGDTCLPASERSAPPRIGPHSRILAIPPKGGEAWIAATWPAQWAGQAGLPLCIRTVTPATPVLLLLLLLLPLFKLFFLLLLPLLDLCNLGDFYRAFLHSSPASSPSREGLKLLHLHHLLQETSITMVPDLWSTPSSFSAKIP